MKAAAATVQFYLPSFRMAFFVADASMCCALSAYRQSETHVLNLRRVKAARVSIRARCL
jgi:hypothetical protein